VTVVGSINGPSSSSLALFDLALSNPNEKFSTNVKHCDVATPFNDVLNSLDVFWIDADISTATEEQNKMSSQGRGPFPETPLHLL
ncbi:hypothetical protein L9F63_007513, partial [Diploptera punctata]